MKKIFSCFVLWILTISVWGQNSDFEEFMDSFAQKNNFNGTILIEKNSKTVYKKSFGYANLPFKVQSSINNRYKIASITKAFTAVLILQLYEQGKINLSETINAYLPEYNGQGADKVTIKELLNMTSGIRNMDEGLSLESVLKNGMPQYQKPHNSDEMLSQYCSDSLVSQP